MLERGRASCRRHRTRIRADQICDPPAGQPGPPGQDRRYLLKRPVGRPAHHVRRCHASFSYQAGSWSKPRRVIAKVEWHPEELYARVGFIVTNMSRPAETVVAFYNKRGMDQGRQGRDQMEAAVEPDVRGQRRAAPTSCARLQSRQFPAHAGDARADQGLVTDKLEGRADQDRRRRW